MPVITEVGHRDTDTYTSPGPEPPDHDHAIEQLRQRVARLQHMVVGVAGLLLATVALVALLVFKVGSAAEDTIHSAGNPAAEPLPPKPALRMPRAEPVAAKAPTPTANEPVAASPPPAKPTPISKPKAKPRAPKPIAVASKSKPPKKESPDADVFLPLPPPEADVAPSSSASVATAPPSASSVPAVSSGFGKVAVQCRPFCESVSVDARAHGPSPIFARVKAGTRTIVVKRGGKTRSRTVSVTADETRRVVFRWPG